ncbi:class I SAM-dependent methyltransferase [Echinicola sp. CAU 1574]|uniref:Class I SAM-dependent methyltransferase n=1 Tax=Echinicola arenosa TaxID=2774144 RepID=A0ABR9AK73_9BACT|nr:class I SAM-dependent methyltransferase [Echinicola arenosa]MBD8488223.1 class I SAM-dependent methyltransferase [Echinicola arenosa]
MANKKDLDQTYTAIDRIFRLSIGEMADFSGAKYDGDFSRSLEYAQHEKHRYVAKSLNITKDSRVLDMGCGWGGFMNFIKEEIGASCLGLTMSRGQALACERNGFDVLVKDCRKVTVDEIGKFDSIVCIGALEHFCSIEEWKEGNQERIYREFFKTVYDLLLPGGKVYIQSMVFGENMIDYKDIKITAKKDTPSHLMALMIKEFPGSWLPYGTKMISRSAAPYFRLISKNSGRLDYIETIRQWRIRFRAFSIYKYAIYLSLLFKFLFKGQLKDRFTIFSTSPNKRCFEKGIMDHYRMVFEKNEDFLCNN